MVYMLKHAWPTLVRRSYRRYLWAWEHEDIERARFEYLSLGQLVPRGYEEEMRAGLAALLTLEEKFDEALREMEALDLGLLSEETRRVVQNNMSCCLACTGQAEKAIEVSQSLLHHFEEKQIQIPPYGFGTLGTAYFFAGKPREAIELLEKGLAIAKDDPRGQANRAYYLGESHLKLGEIEQAKLAYHRACEEFPGSMYALRAKRRLMEMGRSG